MSSTEQSAKLFADACAVIPGGVNSPVRAFNAVGGTPRFITSGSGCWLTDADGNRYVDLVCSWGPMILGHAHPAVVDAVATAVAAGLPSPSGSVSALGYALGYLGGGLLFTLNVLMVLHPDWFGLANAASATQVSFVLVALKAPAMPPSAPIAPRSAMETSRRFSPAS